MVFWALKGRLLLKEPIYAINMLVSGDDITNVPDEAIQNIPKQKFKKQSSIQKGQAVRFF